ncbi:MAG: DUF433 domain-containing protein [Chthoniobacterales bacterium]
MSADSLITRDPNIFNGTPVLKGTRLPVHTLFDYLSDGLSLEYSWYVSMGSVCDSRSFMRRSRHEESKN